MRHDHLQSTLLLALVVGIAACSTSDLPDGPAGGDGADSPRSKDELGLEVARNLASRMNDPALRRYIRDRAGEKFDGDYNFLVQAARFDHLDGADSPRLDDILASDANGDPAGDTDEFMDQLAEIHPLVQIALPQLNDPLMDWDPEQEIPLVAYVPVEQPTDTLQAFDVDGNLYEISGSEPPMELVIVVSENERTEIMEAWRADELVSSLDPQRQIPGCSPPELELLKTDYFTYLPAGAMPSCDLPSVENDVPLPPPPPPPGPCDRDNNNLKDKLYRMKFTNINAYHGANEWFDGGQDIAVEIYYLPPNTTTPTKLVSKLIQGSDGDFRSCDWLGFNCWTIWKSTNTEIVTWDPAVYGNKMLYNWREKDSGSVINLSISGSYFGVNGSASLAITNGDDLLGESIVEYCDHTVGTPTSYDTGSVQFEVKNY